jgi:hypothetical protein
MCWYCMAIIFGCNCKEYLYPRAYQNSRDVALVLSVFSNLHHYWPVWGHICFSFDPIQCHSRNVQYKLLLLSMGMNCLVSGAEPCWSRGTVHGVSLVIIQLVYTACYRLVFICTHQYLIVCWVHFAQVQSLSQKLLRFIFILLDTTRH